MPFHFVGYVSDVNVKADNKEKGFRSKLVPKCHCPRGLLLFKVPRRMCCAISWTQWEAPVPCFQIAGQAREGDGRCGSHGHLHEAVCQPC